MTGIKRPSFSIRGKVEDPQQTAQNNAKAAATVVAEVPQENLPVSEDGVRICWKKYAMILPKEQAAMAGRLMNIRPALKPDLIVEVSIDNRMVASELSGMKAHIEAYLRQQLQNDKLSLNIVISETQTAHNRIYSRVEQFQILEKRNPVIHKLKEALDLNLG